MELEKGTTATTGGDAVRTAGDGGDDGELVICGNGSRFFFRKIAEVFVVEVDVDEGAELAIVAEELLLQRGVLGGEVGKDLSDCRTGNGYRLSSGGKGAERRWDVNVHA
jgi:hypothetical protein